MPMHQHDVLLGRDFIYNTLNIHHDLSITTKKGEKLQQWSTPNIETVKPFNPPSRLLDGDRGAI